MAIEASTNKATAKALTVTLISLLTITSIVFSGFLQPNPRMSNDANINQNQIQLVETDNSVSFNKNANEKEISNPTFYSAQTIPTTYSDNQKFAIGELPEPLNQVFSLLHDNIDQGQIAISDESLTMDIADTDETKNSDYANSIMSDSKIQTPISVNTLNFTTYAYGGDSVQQPDPKKFVFSFPSCTRQGEISGSDAITMNSHIIQKMEFDAMFVAPKICAVGFDEMVIFAASDTITYKGIEFGIRLGLSDGFISGYVQEPKGGYGGVDFQMWQLMPNDGLMHHYTIVMLGSGVSFCVDNNLYGFLNFFSETDYSDLNFWILAVVHRFTDNWDSNGYSMTVENINLNQQ